MPDVVVVGGGIIGVTAAAFCAQRGMSVTLCERDGLAAAASGRNQGLVIGPHPPEMAAIAARSLALYLDLHESTGGAFFLDREPHGCLFVGGVDGGEVLAGADLRVAEPLLAPEIEQAVLVQDARRVDPGSAVAPEIEQAVLVQDARRVDPGSAVAAWAAAARRAGATIRTCADVKQVLHARGTVRGVLTDEGEIHAETVVVAAGPWSWRVCRTSPFDVPVRGVRGWLATTRPAPFRLAHAIEEAWWGALKAAMQPPTVGALADRKMPPPAIAGLLQQDARGRVLLGASLQAATAEHPEGAEALRAIARRACELVPALRDVPLAETRTCQRPMSPDGLPLHGPVPGVDGLVLATGHGAQGITWGPGSGEVVASGIATGAWDEALLPARFA